MVTRESAWDESSLEEQTELHVVAFYEDLRTGELAKEIFDRIRSRVPRDTHTTVGLWRIDVLQDDHLQELADADAAGAAVVIVAARGTRPLPNRLLDCIESALSEDGPARVGLVAILDGIDQLTKDVLPAHRQLQAISSKARVRFFALPSRNLVPHSVMNEVFRVPPNRLLDSSLSFETHSSRAWGLNE